MVGAFSLVGASVIDSSSHTCPCLCIDTLNLSTVNLKKPVGNNQSSGGGLLELSSSFIDPGLQRLGVVNKSSGKQGKIRRLTIVNNLGGQYDDTFSDVKTQLLNYFTYKAVKTVLNQLYEMNPPEYTWFYNYVVANKPGEGKLFIRELGKVNQDLAERVMVTRLHLYGKWVKKCDHAEIYQEISDENLALMRERLIETIIWPSDDSNTEKIG